MRRKSMPRVATAPAHGSASSKHLSETALHLPAHLLAVAAAGSAHTFPTLDKAERAAAASLTDREWEVLNQLSEGKRNREIARDMQVKPGTVKKHLDNIYQKIEIGSRTAAAAIYLRLVHAARTSPSS